MGSPERKGFIESVVEYLWDTRSKEYLQLQLTEVVERQQPVEGAALSSFNPINLMLVAGLLFIAYIMFRKCSVVSTGQILPTSCLPLSVGLSCHKEEEDALHEAPAKTIVDTDGEDDKKLQQNLQEKKRFLEVYPQVKLELEQQIRKLHALADKIDKVHRDCTITHVVAKSTGAVSGVLTILGFALAPMTAGVSLGLSATGLGLGAAAAVTSVSTRLVEKVITTSAEAKASQLVPKDTSSKDKEAVTTDVLEENTPGLISVYKNCFQNLEDIKKNIDAIKLAKDNSDLKADAKCLIAAGKVSDEKIEEVKKAFGGTPLAMTKEARIMGAATAALAMLKNVVSLVEDAKHLHEGAKSEFAAELRQQAQDLEQKLQELIQVHDSLTK